MKPNLQSLIAQTWHQLRRFPTSDALADAVMLQAIWSLVWAPFRMAKFYASTQDEFFSKWRRWNFLIQPLQVFLGVYGLFWHFNLSLRLRRDEKKAWRVATNLALLSVLSYANVLFSAVLTRKWLSGLPELTEEQQQRMTEEQIAKYNSYLEQAREVPLKPLYPPRQLAIMLITLGLTLNVLVRALQKPTRARFHSQTSPNRHTEAL